MRRSQSIHKYVVGLVFLLSAGFVFLAFHAPAATKVLPTPAYYTNGHGKLFARATVPADTKMPFVVARHMDLSAAILVLETNSWIDNAPSYQLLSTSLDSGYAQIRVPWRTWKFQLRAIRNRQFVAGPLKFALSPKTDIWLSAELPAGFRLLDNPTSQIRLLPAEP
jgi:hypothetical protein